MASMLARRITLSLSLVAAIVLAGCGGGGSGEEPPVGNSPPPPPIQNSPPPPADPTPPPADPPAEPVAIRSMGFDNADSDIVAMLKVGENGTPALVLMRDPATGEVRKFVATLEGGITAEATANAEGRLGEFVLGEHRFVFTDYTATQVTATYYAPGGAVVSELINLSGSTSAAAGIAKARVHSHAKASNSLLDGIVDDALNWVADASNTYLPLSILRTAGEAVAEKFEQVRSRCERRVGRRRSASGCRPQRAFLRRLNV